MIDKISSYNNRPSFTGMSISSVKNFIPGISDEAAKRLSAQISRELPLDELETMLRGSNYLSHSVKCDGEFYQIGSVNYKGQDNILDKVEFLQDVVAAIKNGTLYG